MNGSNTASTSTTTNSDDQEHTRAAGQRVEWPGEVIVVVADRQLLTERHGQRRKLDLS